MKVVIATPTVERPHDAYLASLEASVSALESAGFEHFSVFEVGNAYISYARANMLQKAMMVDADLIMFIDHDVSWKPSDLITMLQKSDDVIAGTYRYKMDEEKYMATVYSDDDDRPIVREDGCIHAESVPAGFLRLTRRAVFKFAKEYPDLLYGPGFVRGLDLFNHGAHNGLWWGEDYAFSRRWRQSGEEVWIVPDLDLGHHSKTKDFPGNFHKFLLKQPQPNG